MIYLIEKIEKIASKIYRADEVLASKPIRDQLQLWENDGYEFTYLYGKNSI